MQKFTQNQGYLDRGGIRQIKSVLTNDIFQNELLHIYEQKSSSRDELVRQSWKALLQLTQEMSQATCEHPEVEQLMQELALQLGTVTGKKSYGYLPKRQKALVDEIVDQMERLPVVNECYETWWRFQCQVNDFYSEQARKRPPLSQQKEFRAIKNAVIKEAERLHLDELDQADTGQREQGSQHIQGSLATFFQTL